MEFNENQKQALEHNEGPLLIVAGAGTGKTRVITSRIVRLMKEGLARPAEILALTFTEKAANEMVERVDMGMELGYEEIFIKTFHSFCERMLRDHGMEIGLDPGYKILTGVESWFFFKKNIFEFELNYYRPLGNPNKFIYSLLGHFGKLRDELVEPDAYIVHAETLEGEEREKMLEIAMAYKKFHELLIENNYLTFADLTYYALKLLKTRESVLNEYKRRFKFVMVDEFQDTNYAQYELVKLLALGHKNIVVVGDDDQSIYKWRGASLSNILQFERDFEGMKSVVLIENYRSTHKILDGAYSLVTNNNPDRLEVRSGIDKRLKSNIEGDDDVEVWAFTNYIQEAEEIVKKIADLNKNGVPYEEMAILIRTNRQSLTFVEELKFHGIPFQVRDPKGLFGLEEIKDLVSVARFLANPYDDVAVLRILKMDIFEIPMVEILKMLKSKNNDHLINAVYQYGKQGDNLTIPGTEEGVAKILEILKDLVEFSKKSSCGLCLNQFIQKSGYLHSLVENDRYSEIYNINEFAKQVARFDKENEHNSVKDFVDYLDLLEEANSVMPASDIADRESVQILTAHGSKGLEFDHVFMPNLVKQRFPATNRSDPFEIPEELTNEIFTDGDFHIQEERRLFYVGMTRARKNLYLTYSKKYEGPKEWKVSPFVTEVLGSGCAKEIAFAEGENIVEKLKKAVEPKKSIFELPKFTLSKLSYSQVNTFKICPLMYNYRYLMKIPGKSSHALSFGNSVHETLNQFYEALKAGDVVTFELLMSLYEKNWVSEGYDSADHEKDRKAQGLEILKNFYDTNANPFITPAYLERPFNVKIKDYWISGRIDRIDRLDDGTYEVVDYKTGRLKPNAEKTIKKDLQLSIYALACRDILKLKVSKLSLYFLEDNTKVSTTRDDSQINLLHEEISEMIGEMRNSDFSPTPGMHCSFCDFGLICPAV